MFETFDHVKDANLQAYNRLNMYFNLKKDGGVGVAREYLDHISPSGKAGMIVVNEALKKDGEAYRQALIRNGTPEDHE